MRISRGLLGLALLLALGLARPEARMPVASPRGSLAAPRAAVAVFFEPGFPSPEIQPPADADLRAALGPDAAFVAADALGDWLDEADSSAVLVMPYGSAFPREDWPAIARFLGRGGSLVNLGGVPFGTPVVRDAARWTPGPFSSAFYKTLGLTHTFEVPSGGVASWQPADPADMSSPLLGRFKAAATFALDVRLANTKDFPGEDGTTGQREARLTPLLVGVDARGTRVAAPFVRLDRLDGQYAGGTWLLAPVRGTIDAAAAKELVDQARIGALDFVARPVFAGFHPGETPTIQLLLRRPRRDARALEGAGECLVEVLEASGAGIFSGRVALAGSGEWLTASFPARAGRALQPGLYKVRATIELPAAPAAPQRRRSTTGFWIYDETMLAGGVPMGTRGGGFTRGGRAFPVIGTTYMASDVHRTFLLEPNPYLWDRDFGAMQASGVNLVRTGLWTGWKIYMPEVGTLNETFLRSLDVFLLTARKHDIPVIFTFFAFLPETWGGENPFLDERSVSAQAAFATLIARRYARANDIGWDLINEPSFSSPTQLWKTRPNYDASETAAWQEWLGRRHAGSNSGRAASAGGPGTMARALAAWDAPPGEDAGLPPLDTFSDRNLFGLSRPLKVLDYRLFAQDAFAAWTRRLRAALRASGSANQLVTVGQDEGGLTERPSPLFFGADVDYTCMHTWWNNDALAWDSVMSRRPDRPLLVEETGLMRYERMDGTAWRSEAEAAGLLERKIAIALGTGSAGVVQWIWNTNPYMASDNEAGIGFFRADGTARPELGPFAEIAAFLRAHAAKLASRQSEEVALLVPQSQVLSVRDYATEATRRAVRALYYHLHVPVRAVGEYQVDDTLGAPRAIIAPSPMVIADRAWNALLAAVERGATLLVTGPIDRDEYWRPAPRLAALGVTASLAPVAGAETLAIGDRVLDIGYRGEKLEKIQKGVPAGSGPPRVVTVRHGRGTILWSPLPLELGESIDATVAFYRDGLAQAGAAGPVSVAPADPAVFVGASRFADSVLVALACEGSTDRHVTVRLPGSASSVAVSLPAQRAVLVLLDARTGAEIARTR